MSLFIAGLLVFASNSICSGKMEPSELIDFPKGKAVRFVFKSQLDGTKQPLLLKVPSNYDPAKKWPLLVTLHGYGDGPILAPGINTMVQIGPYGRGSINYSGVGERDVFEAIEIAKNFFSIDEDRIFLCGFSMGGTGTFKLSSRFPDIWAACVPVCGRFQSTMNIENLRHVPFWIHTGGKDYRVPPDESKSAYLQAKAAGFEGWKYSEHGEMGHSFGINWQQVEAWLLTKRRKKKPENIDFSTSDPNSTRAYWVEISEFGENVDRARIQLSAEEQVIEIKTDGVAGFVLYNNLLPVDLGKDIEVRLDGEVVFNGGLEARNCFKWPNKGEGAGTGHNLPNESKPVRGDSIHKKHKGDKSQGCNQHFYNTLRCYSECKAFTVICQGK